MNAERKQSVGVLVIYNQKDEDVRIDLDLQKFLGVEQKPGVGLKLVTRTYIKSYFPASYFIRCDSMAKTENLHNNERFRYRGAPMKESITSLPHIMCCVPLTAEINIFGVV